MRRTSVLVLVAVGAFLVVLAGMVRFWAAFRRGRLIGPETLETMLTPRSPVDDDGDVGGHLPADPRDVSVRVVVRRVSVASPDG